MIRFRFRFLTALSLAAGLALWGTPVLQGSAIGATVRPTVVACGTVITKSTTLAGNVGPCSGNGIIIGADGVTLDLGGHAVSGTSGPKDGTSAGVRLPAKTHVTVQHGDVTGFDAGVLVNGGSRNTLQNLNIHDNVGVPNETTDLGDGIAILKSASNRVLNNVVSRNGYYDNIAVVGLGSSHNLLQGNIIEDGVGAQNNPFLPGEGIVISSFLDQPFGSGGVVHGNDVLGNLVRRNFSTGLSNTSNNNGKIIGNIINDNAPTYYSDFGRQGRPGTGIGVSFLEGVSPGPNGAVNTNMTIQNNQVNHNGLIGIDLHYTGQNYVDHNQTDRNGGLGIAVEDSAFDNKIMYNTARYNVILDFIDTNPGCDNNVWFGNKWGPVQPLGVQSGFAASYFPDCTATGGSGPNPPAPASPGAWAASTSQERSSVPLGSTPKQEVRRGHPAGGV